MLDTRMRSLLAPALDRAARALRRGGLSAGAVTAIGLLVGVAACVAAATELCAAALLLDTKLALQPLDLFRQRRLPRGTSRDRLNPALG